MPFPMFLSDLPAPQLLYIRENRQVNHPRLEWKTTCFSGVVPVGKQQASDEVKRSGANKY
jgi:hypothetical protein